MAIKRINLSFDLDDEVQRVAYYFLMREARGKTEKVSEAILRTYMNETYWKTAITDHEAALKESFGESVNELSKVVIAEVKSLVESVNQNVEKMNDKIDSFADVLNSKEITISNAQTEFQPVKQNNLTDDIDINDEAFESLISMFG